MWVIDKRFDFCYGHRVWTQVLDGEYCENGDGSCKCKHLHGHQGAVHVFLEADQLDTGMVTDFNHLGWLKNWIDDHIDHKFIIDRDDPLFDNLIAAPFQELTGINRFDHTRMSPVLVPGSDRIAGYTVNISFLSTSNEYLELHELLNSYLIVGFTPTSENLSKWMYDIVSTRMSSLGDFRVSQIDWFETPKSRSTYKV